MERKASTHNVVVEFVDQSVSFECGFEAAWLWCRMENNESYIFGFFRKENKDMIIRMARYQRYFVKCIEIGDAYYLDIRLTKNFRTGIVDGMLGENGEHIRGIKNMKEW